MERNINKKICIMAFIFLSGFLPFSSCFGFQSHGEMRNVRGEVVQVEAATAKKCA